MAPIHGKVLVFLPWMVGYCSGMELHPRCLPSKAGCLIRQEGLGWELPEVNVETMFSSFY